MAFIGKFVYMAYHFILYRFNLIDLRFNREGWCFDYAMSQLRVCLSVEGAENVSWLWISLLGRWGSPTVAFTGKFVYMAHYFVLLWLNPFDFRIDRKGRCFEHPVSQLRVFLLAEGAKNVFWPSPSLLRGWVSLTMAFTGKFVNIYIYIYIYISIKI